MSDSDGFVPGLFLGMFLVAVIVFPLTCIEMSKRERYAAEAADSKARFDERCKQANGQVLSGRCYGGAEEITIDVK